MCESSVEGSVVAPPTSDGGRNGVSLKKKLLSLTSSPYNMIRFIERLGESITVGGLWSIDGKKLEEILDIEEW